MVTNLNYSTNRTKANFRTAFRKNRKKLLMFLSTQYRLYILRLRDAARRTNSGKMNEVKQTYSQKLANFPTQIYIIECDDYDYEQVIALTPKSE